MENVRKSATALGSRCPFGSDGKTLDRARTGDEEDERKDAGADRSNGARGRQSEDPSGKRQGASEPEKQFVQAVWVAVVPPPLRLRCVPKPAVKRPRFDRGYLAHGPRWLL